VVINVNPLPPVTANASKNMVCAGDALTLNAGGANTYVWTAYSFLSSGSMISIMPQVATSYTVSGTDVNGCSNTAVVAVAVSPCTGFNEISTSLGGMSVYPNPTSGDFSVVFNTALPKTIRVMDLSGRVVQEISSESASVDFNIGGLTGGIYFVQVQSGEVTETIKLIRE
jgi:hypothetical protein